MMYRREIDGLRAVAVLPVVAFHAGLGVLPGGFIGVDVFFVISGFLITSILIDELTRNEFSIVDFYERRARRILPALFVVMFVTIPFAWAFLTPPDYLAFAKSVVAVVIFSSNILFWRESGYFDLSSDFKPLLHTWSLAVEEQFYLFFPILLYIVWRLGRSRTLGIVGLISLASLAVSEWGAERGSAAAFYLLHSRFWELAAGALLAIYQSSGRAIKLSRASSEVLGWIGLSLIVVSFVVYRESIPFPGLYAVFPVLGAVLVIWVASQETSVGRLLSLRPMVGVGLISYSLYLWHQPVLALARNWSMGALEGPLLALLIVFLFFISYASWRFVELPFRARSGDWYIGRKKVFGSAAGVGACFLVFALFANNKSSFESRLTDRQVRHLQYIGYRHSPEFMSGYRLGSCYYALEESFSAFDSKSCLRVHPDKKNYLLLGDSHAAHLWLAMSTGFPEVNLMQANASNCRPVMDPNDTDRCTLLIQYILNEFLGKVRVDGVVLSARWADGDRDKLLDVVARLSGKVGKIIIVGPTVEYIKPLPLLLVKKSGEAASRTMDVRGVVDESVFRRSEEIRVALADARVEYVDLVAQLCSEGRCQVTTEDDVPLVWDYGHFTLAGARSVVAGLRAKGIFALH